MKFVIHLSILTMLGIGLGFSARGDQMEKLDKKTATKIAEAYLSKDRNKHNFKIIEDRTREFSFGYAFFYVPEKYIETKNINDLDMAII
ncbi:MAG: hypothetical protein ACK5P7_03155 [Bdellovibrio sp.]|jgi:hypothetical protein